MLIYQILFPLLLLIFIPWKVNSQNYSELPYPENRKSYHLNGNVLTLSEKTYVPPTEATYYEDQKEINTDNSWRLVRQEEVNFDSLGNILKKSIHNRTDAKKDKMQHNEYSFYYNSDKLIAVALQIDARRADSVIFQYKKNGLAENYRVYNDKNELSYKVTYTYNKDYRPALVRKMDKQNLPVAMVKYKYEGKVLKQQQYFDEQFKLHHIIRYSKQKTVDKLINESHAVFTADGKMKEGLSGVKDSLGNILEQSVIDSARQVTDYRRYRYNAFQDRIEEKVFMPEELLITMHYRYDSDNNWIRKEVYHNGWLHSITFRELDYQRE